MATKKHKPKIIRRKVVLVWGNFTEKSKDFVLELACAEDCNCEICKDSFWIEGEEQYEDRKRN